MPNTTQTALGVSVEEAICRLAMQKEIGYLGATLQLSASPTPMVACGSTTNRNLASLCCSPKTRQATLSTVPVKDSPLAGIVRARKARASLRSLEQAQRQAHDIIEATGIPVETGINVYRNRVELYAIDVKELQKALKDAGSRLPDHVTLIEVQQHSSPAS